MKLRQLALIAFALASCQAPTAPKDAGVVVAPAAGPGRKGIIIAGGGGGSGAGVQPTDSTTWTGTNTFQKAIARGVATLASASTIAPTKPITHVTGTVTISTITPPSGFAVSSTGGCLDLVADAAWSTNTSGNINSAVTAQTGNFYRFCYDNGTSKWYLPPYGGTGTVTNVGSGTGLTGGPITGTGSLSVDQTFSPSWSGTHTFQKPIARGVATLASATTIAPTTPITHVTGTTAIATITPPTGFAVSSTGGCLDLVADGAWSTTTAGNINSAITATAGNFYRFCYDNGTSKWYSPPTSSGSSSSVTGGTLLFDQATWASTYPAVGAAGNYANGCTYKCAGTCTISGVRWYQPSGKTANVTVDLWNGSTKEATKTVTPTAGAINSVTFTTPYQIPSGALNPAWSVSVWDGTNQLLSVGAGNGPFGAGSVTAGTTAPINLLTHVGVSLMYCGYGSGEVAPSTVANNDYPGISPVLTFP